MVFIFQFYGTEDSDERYTVSNLGVGMRNGVTKSSSTKIVKLLLASQAGKVLN